MTSTYSRIRFEIWKAWKIERENFFLLLSLANRENGRGSVFRTHLVGVDDDLALFLITPCDEEHVVERGGVVDDRVVLERGQDVPAAELEEMHAALVDGEP